MARVGKEQLIKLQMRFKTDAAIARLYGLSRQAIAQQRKRFGISASSTKYISRNSEIKELSEKGISAQKLAVKFRLSKMQIYRILKKFEKSV